MRRVAAAVAVVLLLLLAGPLTGVAVAGPAAEQPSGAPLSLVLDELTPRVVTTGGPAVLTVTGVLTNNGDEPVGQIGLRLQRGEPLRSEDAVRDAVEGNAPTDAIAPQFDELPDTLAPGAQVPVRLTVPLRGAPETTLALTAPGTYELLVNVNGVPEGGDRARLAAVRMLLPVLGLPAGADGSAPVPADAAAVPFTLLYPVTDEPRRLSTVPGQPVLLRDDLLADSFAPGGRLAGLVAALAGSAPPGSPVRAATCVAVDPDLLQTAAAMSGGYQVQTADGSLVPGRGAEAAAAWLAAFRAAVVDMCVLALPYADADVVALTRGGLTAPAADAVAAARAIVTDLLGTPVLPATAWPADGVVDEPTAQVLEGAGVDSLVLSADGVERPGAGPAGTVPLAGPAEASAVLTDPLLTLAAGGPPADDAVVTGAGTAAGATTARGALATQDALGAVAFRAAEGPPAAGAPLVLAPPHHWDAGGPAAGALLDGIAQMTTARLLTPRGLGATVAAGPPVDADGVALSYPLAAGAREIGAPVVESIADVLDAVADLRSSVVEDGQGVEPDAAFDPLRRGALRPASAVWRGKPLQAAVRAAEGTARIAAVRGSVEVLEPPSPFSLGASESPLLLTVANGLPVTMSVRVELASTSGLRVAPIPAVEIPPLGRRQVQANAEVLRSGVFTVDAAVRTQDGGLLGPPSRLQVRSTAYGTITLWLTGTAGVLLVVLAARRILRRVRAEPGRHTTGRSRTGVPEAMPDRATPPPMPVPARTPPPGRTPSPGRTPPQGRTPPRRTPPRPTEPLRRTAPTGPTEPTQPTDRTDPSVPTVPVPARTRAPDTSNAPSRPGPSTGRNRPGPSSRGPVVAPPLPTSAPDPRPDPPPDPSHPASPHPANPHPAGHQPDADPGPPPPTAPFPARPGPARPGPDRAVPDAPDRRPRPDGPPAGEGPRRFPYRPPAR